MVPWNLGPTQQMCMLVNTCDKIIDLFHLWVIMGGRFVLQPLPMIPWHQWVSDTFHSLIITMWHIIRQCWHIIRHFLKRFGPLTFNPQLSPLTHVSGQWLCQILKMSKLTHKWNKSIRCCSQVFINMYTDSTNFDPINIKMELGPSMTPSHWRWKIDKKTLLPQWPTHEQNWPCYHNDWPLYQWLLVTLDNQWRIKR